MILALIIIGGVSYYLLITAGLFWAIFSILILFVSLGSFFIPTEYRIDEQGIRVKRFIYSYYRPLSEFRRIYILKNGVLFSPFSRPTFLNNFRGLFLLFPKDREGIVEYLKKRFNDLIEDKS